MPIVFEEVTGEVAARSGTDSAASPAPAPAAEDDLREKLLCELALMQERQARLFSD